MIGAALTGWIDKLPREGAALDFLKILAAAFMLIDHINFIFFEGKILWMALIGRSVFPLFCFAVGAHLARGLDLGRYLPSMLLLALLSQPFYFMAMMQSPEVELGKYFVGNVIFTLAAGAVIGEFLKEKHALLQWGALLVVASFFMMPKMFEYGYWGVSLPFLFERFLNKKMVGLIGVPVVLFFLNARFDLLFAGEWVQHVWILMAIICGMGFSFLAVSWASGQPRFLHKYALYVFYPGHLFLLWILAKNSLFWG